MKTTQCAVARDSVRRQPLSERAILVHLHTRSRLGCDRRSKTISATLAPKMILLGWAFVWHTAAPLHAQAQMGERVEIQGTVLEMTPNEISVQTDSGQARVSLGRDRIPVPGGFLSEPGKNVEFDMVIRETTAVLQLGQHLRYEAECDPITLIPIEPPDELHLLPVRLGIKSSWKQLDEAAEDEPLDEPVEDESAEAEGFERATARFEVVGMVQRIEDNALTLKVNTRRVRLPTDEGTAVVFESDDPAVLRPGDRVEVVGRRVGDLILATRIRASRINPELVIDDPVVAIRDDPMAPALADPMPAVPAPIPPDPAPMDDERAPVELKGADTPSDPLREGPATPGKYFGKRVRIN